VVALVVGEMVVGWRFRGYGTANVGWSYSAGHQEGPRDQSLVLIKCFLQYLHQLSLRVL
jgi:hypothetical protein